MSVLPVSHDESGTDDMGAGEATPQRQGRYDLQRVAPLVGVAFPPLRLSGLSLDSRAVGHGDGFVAIRGMRGHGFDHAAEAVARGASVILHDEHVDARAVGVLPCRCIEIPGLGAKLSEVAGRFFHDPSAELDACVGVTGTNGKSTVAWMAANILQRSAATAPAMLMGTLGAGLVGESLTDTGFTSPDAVSLQRLLRQARDAGARSAVMELSSHALDQQRADGVRVTTAVLTNVTRDHLDYHGTMAAYVAAKERLFARADLKFAILNRDAPVSKRYRGVLKSHVRCLTYGFDAPCVTGATDIWVRVLDRELERMTLDFVCEGERARVTAPFSGSFNAANAAAAVAAAVACDVPFADAVAALVDIPSIPGRMQVISLPQAPRVVVDFAHTPDALESVLAALRPMVTGELTCVFGCGGDRDRGKRPQMGAIAGRFADRVVLTSDNPRSEDPQAIIDEIRAGVPASVSVSECVDRGQAIAEALASASPDDVVLVAGKGHEKTQETTTGVRPWSDVAAIHARLGDR